MEAFSELLAFCAGNSPVTGEFPSQRPVTQSFDVFLDLRLNKPLSKQSRGWWFETLSRPLWRHCKDFRSSTPGGNIWWTQQVPMDIHSLVMKNTLQKEKVVINQVVSVMYRIYIQMHMRYGSACDAVFPDNIHFITITKFRVAAN